MDLLTHAVVGAVTGVGFGHPVAGAVIAAAPDFVLGIRRKSRPSKFYNITHSLAFLILCSVIAELIGGWGALVGVSLASHLFLDMPTHGSIWAPPLLYPFSNHRFTYGEEWEFFNFHWWAGLYCSFLWCTTVWTLSHG
jgi:hypothetical protein